MYERTWSEEVYERFAEKHLLAVREVNHLYRISEEALVKAVMVGSDRWRGYKALVKHVEKAIDLYYRAWRDHHKGDKNGVTFVKYLRENLQRRCFPAELDLVDSEVQGELDL